jgi:hypothetical protein
VVVSVVTCTVIDNWVGDEVWVSLEFVGDLLDTMYHSLQHNSVDFFSISCHNHSCMSSVRFLTIQVA